MKTTKFLSVVLGAVALSAGFVSCSEDEDSWNPQSEGSKINMASTRAFVLNEGAYQSNNAGLTYFDWVADTTYTSDLYQAQNGVKMGDTGQDIVLGSDGVTIYTILNGSQYLAKLNSVGVEKARYAFDEKLGAPRYLVEKDGFLYVTSYGGYVAKIKAADLSLVDTVKVGKNPEFIVEKDNKICCSVSGWGEDKRVAVISLSDFKNVTYCDVMDNPDQVIVVAGRVFVQGYGAYYDYPWGELKEDGTFQQIGNCSKWAAYGNTLYLAYSETDWNTYATTTTFKTYDAATSTLSENSPFKNAPAELASSSVYGISTNPYNGDIYVMTSDYVTNGKIYHFKNDGTYVKTLQSTGISPRKIIFLQ